MRRVWSLLRRTAREYSADRCPQLSAAIAYHVLFAVIPLFALLVAMLGLVLRIPEVERTVVDHVLEAVPLRAGVVFEGVRTVSGASGSLSIVGALGLAWASLGLFSAVRDALNLVWGVRQRRGYARQKLLDLGSVVGLGLLLGASILGTSVLHSIRSASVALLGQHSGYLDVVWSGTAWAFPAAVSFVAFLMLYRHAPNVRHSVGDVWPGALAAALLFEGAKHGFAFYVSHFNRFEVLYGALGAVMLFLLWIYVSANVLLIGAELASEYERTRRRARAQAALPAAGV